MLVTIAENCGLTRVEADWRDGRVNVIVLTHIRAQIAEEIARPERGLPKGVEQRFYVSAQILKGNLREVGEFAKSQCHVCGMRILKPYFCL
jgi:hypothetical protein